MRMEKLKATELSDGIKTKDKKLLEDTVELAYIEGAIGILNKMSEEEDFDIAKVWAALRKRFDVLTGE